MPTSQPALEAESRSVPGVAGVGWARHLWIPAAALLVACIYLPTLGFPFDFVDDGNLVYPAPQLSLPQRLGLYWKKVEANFHHLGPFRPVLWAHWELSADLLRGDPFSWRLVRLAWSALSAGMLLWLLRELGARPWVAVLTAALAMGSPGRSEIWLSLTLSEGVAMPYALAALVCAVRASRSGRPLRWDLAGCLCLLMALGCKNVFVALIPAMVVLRLLGGGLTLREGLRRNLRGAAILSLPLVMPVVHYVVFRLTWHPGQYTTGGVSLAQARLVLWVVIKGLNLDFAGPGLALAAVAVFATPGAAAMLGRHRVALLAGALILAAGITVYLPLDGTSFRYCMPAVWGGDILIALLLTTLAESARGLLPRVAWGALAVGLVVVLVANLGQQDATASRSALLWQVVRHIERQAPPNSCGVWESGPQMHEVEGLHVAWHLVYRQQRRDVTLLLRRPGGDAVRPPMVTRPTQQPTFRVGRADADVGLGWRPAQKFVVPYRFGWRQHECRVFVRESGA